MKVLITGGAGFIGSHIADACIAAGCHVTILDDLSTGNENNIPSKARFVKMSVLDPDMKALFLSERFNAVCHLAAQMDVRKSVEDPVFDATVNVLGGIRLMDACIQSGVTKVIYSSTGGAVYGEPEFLPVTEDHPIRPECPYGVSKHTVEHYLELYSRLYGLSYTIFRYPNVYGPRQNPRGEAGVNAIFIGKLLQGEVPLIYGDGEQVRDYVFVKDIARANVIGLEKGEGQILNLGSGIGTSVNQICDMLGRIMNVSQKPRYAPARKGEIQQIYLDASKAEQEIGWKPSVTFEEGLKATVQYFRENPDRL